LAIIVDNIFHITINSAVLLLGLWSPIANPMPD
jgi:hypothetical protein